MVDFSLNSWKKVSDMPRTSSLMSSWLVAFTCAAERGTGKGRRAVQAPQLGGGRCCHGERAAPSSPVPAWGGRAAARTGG